MQCVRNAAPRALLTVYYCLLRVPSGATHFALQSTHTDTHARVRTPVGSDAAETRRRVNVCVCAVAVVAVVVERNDEATRVMGNNEKYSERLFVAARRMQLKCILPLTRKVRALARVRIKSSNTLCKTTRHDTVLGGEDLWPFVLSRCLCVWQNCCRQNYNTSWECLVKKMQNDVYYV